MTLGRQMRRRRASRARRRRAGPVRTVLRAAAVLVLGSAAGYLYATQVVFPAEAAPGDDYRTVPDLRGLGGEESRAALATEGLMPGEADSISHPEAPRGTVLGQSPLPGQLAVPGAEIGLTFSLGPERRPIPDVTELRVDQATTLLEASGFVVTLDSIESDVREGRVASTFPAGGLTLPIPAQVLVSVSLGPPLVTMPVLAGLQEETALILLDSLGLAVGEVETRFRFGFNQGEVLEHFPPADSVIPRGTEVRLVIGRRGFFPE